MVFLLETRAFYNSIRHRRGDNGSEVKLRCLPKGVSVETQTNEVMNNRKQIRDFVDFAPRNLFFISLK